MSEPASIYPIRQLYFRCDGCAAQWMLRCEPPLACIEDLKAFTSDPNRMEPCPNACGSRTASMAFRVRDPSAAPATEPADPFRVFDAPPEGKR